ncbi:MAG TPA: hypothetical protein VF121_10725, partial [Thermoanaerobaculia bacterium]|nr:hypothetical protein [Thermoanaerobaculia bacterium]
GLFAVAAAGQPPQDAAATTESPAAEPSAERPVEASATEALDEEPSLPVGESTAQMTAPPEGQAAAASRRPAPIRYERNAVLLVVMLIGLLSFLFWLLLKWSHQLDQASYLGQVYSESVEDFEYKRLAGVATEKLRNAEYQREIVRDSAWLEMKPQRPEGVEAEEDYWLGTGTPGVARLRAGTGSGTDDADARDARNKYRAAMDEWRSKVESAADELYRRELAKARSSARKRAKLATDVDLSTLRGRGAEFVLEFTTVVVIIFAAVILGVLNILGTEQIGTLLAAIAGYVLGRATTRPRSGAAEAPAAASRQGQAGQQDTRGDEA